MESCLLVFREELTAEREAVLARDLCAVEFRRELGVPFSFLLDIIDLLHDDVETSRVAIYSMSALNKMSLLEMREWRPLYRLRLNDELIAFINKFSSLIEKLSDVSSCVTLMDVQLRSYAYLLNEAFGSDAQSFSELFELTQTNLMAMESEKLAKHIRGLLEQFGLE